jgi:hypothetical protein
MRQPFLGPSSVKFLSDGRSAERSGAPPRNQKSEKQSLNPYREIQPPCVLWNKQRFRTYLSDMAGRQWQKNPWACRKTVCRGSADSSEESAL